MTSLYLIDGTALAYRSYFAFATSSRGGLSRSDGHPTSATFGFTITLRSLLERERPDLCAVAFDGPRKDLERTKVYPEYKSTREKAPEEMLAQLGDIEEVVRAHDLPIVSSPGHEADDVIGALAVQGRDAGMDVFIVTGDKDFMQLVDDKIKLWSLRSSTRSPEIIGAQEVREKFGVEPAQMIDMLALMGDSSDNVPGVPRVGQKTASTLLNTFGTLDQVLERYEEVKQPSIRKALAENRDLALLSRDLVTIQTTIPLSLNASDLEAPKPDLDTIRELFTELEFDSLAKELPQQNAPSLEQDYRIIRDAEQLQALITELEAAKSFAVDTETTSLDALQAELVGVSFCMVSGVAYYIPFNADPPVLEGGREALIAALKPLLENPDLQKTGQNIKYDLHVFAQAGIRVQGVDFDTMLASYCLAAGVQAHNMDALSLRHFGYKKIPTKELLGTGKKQITFDQVDIDLAGRYAAEDADFTWRLREALEGDLEGQSYGRVFREIEMPLIAVLEDMEAEGIAVDSEHLEKLSIELANRIKEIEDRIYERAEEPFNLNSPAQIGKVLFEKLEVHRAANIKRPAKTKTGQFKTDAAVLEKLAAHHEVPKLILDYRQLSKLKSTYVDSLPTMINPRTGRIHTSFNQAVAATGRLSSDNPNLQNIPIRSAEGREVRKSFISRGEGWQLLSADYSQIELRILAHMSGDTALLDAFQKREDIHTRTAALVHGIMPAVVDAELRSQAKVINYGLVYGMGATRLASETGMKTAEAKKFIESYFKALPAVKDYLDRTLEEARENGAVYTMFGRRRLLPDIHAKSPMMRIASENMAVNTPIQGTAADIIKLAMLRMHAELAKNQLSSKLLLQVHDELVLDVPDDELELTTTLLRECMENAAELDVPLEVTIGHGRSWLDAH
ncbi:MAG: DNA polymerase I [Planctomycetota bacterium]|jgi:DNA polymerase-1